MNHDKSAVKQTVLHFRSSAVFAGPERYILELEAPLRRQGFSSAVMALHRHPPSGPSTHPLVTQAWSRELPAWQITDNGPLSPEVIRAVTERLRSSQFSLLHTHDYKSNLMGLVAARQAGAAVVATVHLHTQTDRKLRLYRLLDLVTLRAFDHVILVSGALRSRLLRASLAAGRVTVIPNGIDARAFAGQVDSDPAAIQEVLGLADGQLIVLGIGRLTTQKGFEYLIQAAPTVKAKQPEVQFLIVGDGPERHHLQHLTMALGVADSVAWLGHREDVANFMATADIVVLPSVREGTPYVLLEALALARPVVATRVGGIPHVVHDRQTGLLVPPRDPAALARAITWMLDHPAEAAVMGARGRDLVEQEFSAETMARRTAEIYREVLSKVRRL